MTQLHQRKRSRLSLSDEWALPVEDFERECKKYDFYPNLDVAASQENTKCSVFFNKNYNALEHDWLIRGFQITKVYVNPPNHLTQKFIAKSYEQNEKFGVEIMMVIPINATITKNGIKFIWNNPRAEIHPLYPTPKFIHNGKQLQQARNRYCVVLFK